MITYKHYNKTDLGELITSPRYQELPDIPISVHRAKSQIVNPRAKDSDVLLTVAWKDEKVMGYLGFLPDFIVDGENTIFFAWMSCIWIHPQARGLGIAKTLVEAGLKLYDGNIAATEFTDAAKKLYDKVGAFTELPELSGMRYYVGLNSAHILPLKNPRLKPFRSLFSVIDRSLNTLINAFRPLPLKNFKARGKNGLPGAAKNDIALQNAFSRTFKDLNWMLKNPWVLEKNENAHSNLKYYFTSAAKQYHCKVYFADEQESKSPWVIIQIRDGHLQIPFWDPAIDESAFMDIINSSVKVFKVHTVSCYNETLNAHLNAGLGFKWTKKKQRKRYLFTTKICSETALSSANFQPGAGDAAFT